MKKKGLTHNRGEKNKIKFILRKLADYVNISDMQLAKEIGIPYTTLYQLLQAENISPRAETLLPIARYFKVSIEQLLGESPLKLCPSDQIREDLKKAKKWDFELYSKCLAISYTYFKQNKAEPSTDQALSIIKEIYMYTLNKNLKEPDDTFVDWFISHSLSKNTF